MYSVQLNIYEGPLDLLYDLISKQKIDIKDIAIKEITTQYMNYLNLLEKMDLEITSEFLAMATKLLEIKSKYLLFKQRNDEEDPRLELVEKIEEYKKYKEASDNLNINYSENTFFRKKEEVIVDEKLDLSKINLEEIEKLLPIIFTIKKEEIVEDENLDKITKQKIIPIEEKINYIKSLIKDKKEISFSNLIKENKKNEVIAIFLAILELIKSNDIKLYQENFFGEITLQNLS